MQLPTTYEEQESRLKEIRRQLLELSPKRQEYLDQLRKCEGRIEQLCAEKNAIERSRIKITVCRTGASGRRSTDQPAKPIDTKKALLSLDKAQTQELLLHLMRMQRELQREEEEENQIAVLEREEEFPIEGYDPEDEEDEEEITPPIGHVAEGNLITLVYDTEEYDSIETEVDEYACV